MANASNNMNDIEQPKFAVEAGRYQSDSEILRQLNTRIKELEANPIQIKAAMVYCVDRVPGANLPETRAAIKQWEQETSQVLSVALRMEAQLEGHLIGLRKDELEKSKTDCGKAILKARQEQNITAVVAKKPKPANNDNYSF